MKVYIWFWRTVFFLLLVLVTYLSLAPNPEGVESGKDFTEWLANVLFGGVVGADKFQHFFAYLALGGAFVMARFGGLITIVRGILFLAVLGGVLEVVQSFIETRDTNIWDAVANGLGALSAAPLAIMLDKVLRTIFSVSSEEISNKEKAATETI